MAWILTLTVTPDQVDAVTGRLWELGTSGIALDGSELMAGFESEEGAASARADVGGTMAPVDPTAWETPETVSLAIGDRTLTVDAGRSFGHGNHPTTRLCLRALELHVRPGHHVLDVGCGSGVLSLAAKALGAGRVTAIDIDETATAATRANAASNQLELETSTTPIADLAGRFDVVVTNMLIADLEPIADDVGRLANDVIIVSGALVDQRDRVLAALSPWARLVDETVEGEWLGATLRIGDR